MLSSPDTFPVLLSGIVYMVGRMATEFTFRTSVFDCFGAIMVQF